MERLVSVVKAAFFPQVAHSSRTASARMGPDRAASAGTPLEARTDSFVSVGVSSRQSRIEGPHFRLCFTRVGFIPSKNWQPWAGSGHRPRAARLATDRRTNTEADIGTSVVGDRNDNHRPRPLAETSGIEQVPAWLPLLPYARASVKTVATHLAFLVANENANLVLAGN